MKRKIIKVKGEGFLKIGSLVCFSLFLLFNFFLSAKVSVSNAELQRTKSKIETQEKLNLSMEMKINELISLDNAMEVAGIYGLEYNNKNIKVIENESE